MTEQEKARFKAQAEAVMKISGWTPSNFIWALQEKMHHRAVQELGGTPSILEDVELAKFSATLKIVKELYPNAKPEKP